MSNSYFGFDPEKVKVNWRESRFDNLPPLDTVSKNTKQESEMQKSKSKQCKKRFFNKYPLVFCILLCVILYLLFLTIAFTETTKRDTYICYTTKTGTHFHASNCKYLNTAYETTVYEASKKYKPCSYCNPFIANNKTTITITERNYLAPTLISIPTSTVIYILLITHKKEDNKGDDL